MIKYEEKLRCSIYGIPHYPLFTESGLQIAIGYQQVIANRKGLWVEFLEYQLISDSYYIDPNEDQRANNLRYCYVKYRTDDTCNLKIYKLQRETEGINSITMGRYYIAPFHLYDRWGNILITSPS